MTDLDVGVGSWHYAFAHCGRHVHVCLRCPGPVGHRPKAGDLTVDAEEWPALQRALESLPHVERMDLTE